MRTVAVDKRLRIPSCKIGEQHHPDIAPICQRCIPSLGANDDVEAHKCARLRCGMHCESITQLRNWYSLQLRRSTYVRCKLMLSSVDPLTNTFMINHNVPNKMKKESPTHYTTSMSPAPAPHNDTNAGPPLSLHSEIVSSACLEALRPLRSAAWTLPW